MSHATSDTCDRLPSVDRLIVVRPRDYATHTPGAAALDAPGTIRHSTIQLVRNSWFSGRFLEQIRDQLLSAGTEGGQPALTSPPRAGKIQTALGYTCRFVATHHIVRWGIGEPAHAGPRSPRSAASEGHQGAGRFITRRVAPERSAPAPAGRVRQRPQPADGADLMLSGSGHLLTSRNPKWADRVPQLDVGVFHRNESVELFDRLVPGVPTADAARLAERAGDLPLTIRGVLGAVRALTDERFRDRDAAYLPERFGDGNTFSVLARVPIVTGHAPTPDWTPTEMRLHEWSEAVR
jgi:hypothetical protein